MASGNHYNASSESGKGRCVAARPVTNCPSMGIFTNERIGDGINLNSSEKLEPNEGMEFDSKEEAFSFYKEYAKSVGFEIITKASRRSRISGKFIDAKFVCTRYGSKTESKSTDVGDAVRIVDCTQSFPLKQKRGRINRSGLKTDCKACLHVKRRQDGRWIIRSFVKEHNHEFFPDQAYRFCGQKNSFLGKVDTDVIHNIRGRRKDILFSLSPKSSGHKKLEKRKGLVTNQVGGVKRQAFEERDAKLLLGFCIQMQEENPNFFYAVDLDEKQQLKNLIWVDAKGRLDSGFFSDVVSFDTTYIKNEYKLPVLPILGVNHHSQLVLLGCALIGDESKATYIWLMRAWCRAIGGRIPSVILTDQVEVLKEAILEVFPSSRHYVCLWHILSKMPEKLGQAMRQSEHFMKKFNKCIFQSRTDEQFEKRWWKMVDNFNLQGNTWFESLYEDRERWIPMYARGVFLAGMSTKQRSESINSAFDKLVQRKTAVKEFLDQYRATLRERFEEEAKADFETWHRQPGLKSPSPFGKQMASLYTHEIFRKFQVEVVGGIACHPRKVSEDGPVKTFQVQDFEQNRDFIVVWNEESSNISCSCRLFEFSGFLCRHTLIVLQMSGIQSIPSHYVLKRWTKDAKDRKSMAKCLVDVVPSRAQRYKDLCACAFKLSDEGSLSEESYNIVFNALEDALRRCGNLDSLKVSLVEATSPTIQGGNGGGYEGDHEGSMSKINNAHKTTQVDAEQEALSLGMHESWQLADHSSVEVTALGCSYGSQESTQGVANSRAPNLDEYYGSQQIMRGMAHLHPDSQIHGPHFIGRQRLQGMGQLSFRPQTIPACFNIQDVLQDTGNSATRRPQLHGSPSRHMQQSKHLPR